MSAEAGAAPRRVLLVGPPNAGKSTLFNRLTGSTVHTGNYAGTTVGVQRAAWQLGREEVELVDLPGTASMVAHAADEEVTLRALLEAHRTGGVVIVVLDGPRLARSLYLALQVLELGLPTLVAVNLVDEARAAGRVPDVNALEAELGVRCVAISARTGEGLGALAQAVEHTIASASEPPAGRPNVAWPVALEADVDSLLPHLPPWATTGRAPVDRALTRWMIQSAEGRADKRGELPQAPVVGLRKAAQAAGRDVDAEIVAARYAWIDARMPALVVGSTGAPDRPALRSDALDRVLLHPVSGGLVFLAVTWFVFVALFSWSDVAMGWIEDAFALLGAQVGAVVASAAGTSEAAQVLRDLLVDGVIGGVGAVLVFLPQIAVLFFLIAVLDDVGYLARAAALVDRVLRWAGLPGRAFVPLLSGFACAVPAILATRSLPRFRDRLLVMAVLPLTTCSARLPVYALVISALFPETLPGWVVPVRPTMLLLMYVFSTITTVLAAVVIGRVVLPAPVEPTVLELPPYRLPSARSVARGVTSRAGDFVREAGSTILVATIVLWALLAFPRYTPEQILPPEVLVRAQAEGADLEEVAGPYAIEASFGGRIGKLIEPVIAPLGFDWKIGVGLIGAFAAREVFVSTMGLVYGIADADEESLSLREHVQSDVRADGTLLWTPTTGLALMVFFSLAMQCTSTIAVLRKESGGWRWPAFVTAYMSALAWVAAWGVQQVGSWWAL